MTLLASLHDDACLSCPSVLGTSEKGRVSVSSLESETLLANVAKADRGLTCKLQPLRFREGLLSRPLHLPGGNLGSASWMVRTYWANISISRSLGSDSASVEEPSRAQAELQHTEPWASDRKLRSCDASGLITQLLASEGKPRTLTSDTEA